MTETPDNSDAEPASDPDLELERRLRETTRFSSLLHLPICDSTQDIAATSASATDRGVIVWADRQQAGRGRGDNHWDGAPGLDVEATMFAIDARIADPTTLAAAFPAALADALEPFAQRPIRIKWPNDLLCDGRKLAGILIDATGNPPRNFSVGVGANVNRTEFPPDLAERAISLALASGRTVDRHAVLLQIATAIDTTIARLVAGDLEPLAERFRARLGLVDRRVQIVSGDTEHHGVLTDLDLAHATLDGVRSHPLGLVRRLAPALRTNG